MTTKILSLQDVPSLFSWEKNNLAKKGLEGLALDLEVWKAKWRQEQLEFYLAQGWSFGIWEDDFRNGSDQPDHGPSDRQWKGYFLAQTLLFFEGITQTLWVEHLRFTEEEIGRSLVDLSVRYAKDKHLQRVIFAEGEKVSQFRDQWSQLLPWGEGGCQIKVSK